MTLEYFPFGETFVEEHSNTNRTPYLFNGKELDEETGLYYYRRRYYDSRTSVWISADPWADLYPNMSPYVYTYNNPVIYHDPNGQTPKGIYIHSPWFMKKIVKALKKGNTAEALRLAGKATSTYAKDDYARKTFREKGSTNSAAATMGLKKGKKEDMSIYIYYEGRLLHVEKKWVDFNKNGEEDDGEFDRRIEQGNRHGVLEDPNKKLGGESTEDDSDAGGISMDEYVEKNKTQPNDTLWRTQEGDSVLIRQHYVHPGHNPIYFKQSRTKKVKVEKRQSKPRFDH